MLKQNYANTAGFPRLKKPSVSYSCFENFQADAQHLYKQQRNLLSCKTLRDALQVYNEH